MHPPSEALMCCYCRGLLVDPQLSKLCGHSFCRACTELEDISCVHDSCSVLSNSVIPNRAVLCQIDDLIVYCRYARFGVANTMRMQQLTGVQVNRNLGLDFCRILALY